MQHLSPSKGILHYYNNTVGTSKWCYTNLCLSSPSLPFGPSAKQPGLLGESKSICKCSPSGILTILELTNTLAFVHPQVFCPSQWESHGAGEDISAHLHWILLVTKNNSLVTSPMQHVATTHRELTSSKDATDHAEQGPDFMALNRSRRGMWHCNGFFLVAPT